MIRLHRVTKSYSTYQAIRSLSLTIHKGEVHGIIGASGAGKSTLLRLINLLEKPDEGEVEVNGQLLTSLNHTELRGARKSIGMIFQHFHLVSNKTVLDNVVLALEIADYPKRERKQRAMECLQFVGLNHFADKYPSTLSGGQQQRVAIARALANRPQVLLCDEPTSALDANTTAEILGVLETINQQLGVTIVIVSHEMSVISSICHRVTVLEGGDIYETLSIQPSGIQRIQNGPQSFIEQLKKEGKRVDA